MPPTLYQRKLLWAAITAFSVVVIAGVITLAGWIVVKAISYLQPLLIPVAIAAILAYLLEPVVRFLEKRRFPRTLAVVAVFLVVTSILAGLVLGILPTATEQGRLLAQNLPGYTTKVQALIIKTADEIKHISELRFFQQTENPEEPPDIFATSITNAVNSGVTWLQTETPTLTLRAGEFLRDSLSGFLGVFGFLLSLILVPIFLFFFLKDGRAIASNWSRYLPIRASPLKNEIVSLFTEINSYLINFFRGQLMVSLINGALVATGLLFILPGSALVIGLMVGILGLIPYAGVLISWIPAVIIAAAQYQDWVHPLIVTAIFIGVNQLEGLFISPKIVGESVGLHPLTVIISVLAWSLIMGGLLGALLAVPLTATLKVLLKRYFWDRPPEPLPEAGSD